ncbi:MAG: hypothetical protein ACT6FF_03510 [Methanosarcinaceae archaeon]
MIHKVIIGPAKFREMMLLPVGRRGLFDDTGRISPIITRGVKNG